jgi:hypothetical protein
MLTLLTHADHLLRGQTPPPSRAAMVRLGLLLLVFGLIYGCVMGTFGGLAGQRLLQVVFSAVKVPLLLLVTFAVCLPSFFVLNTLLGLRDDFVLAVRALLATQAGLTVILASLSPLTALWYVSSADYTAAILCNGVMFGVASVTAQGLLRRLYRPLIARNRRQKWMIRLWLVLYIFVGIQAGWVMRPFVGDPNQPVQFFRNDAWSNAYEVVAGMVWGTVRGGR